jgi:translation initiation factor 2B subunit (eIF-2B alpha/beta/delta family)
LNNLDKLDKILTDKTSGSEQILSGLNNYLLEIIDNPVKIKSDLKEIKDNLFHFAAVENYINSFEQALKSNQNEAKKFLKLFDKNSQNKFLRIYKNAGPFLENIRTVLTLSNSKTLLEIFMLWAKDNKRLHVIICESRPKFEGRIFAKHLLKENIKTTIITDAMISLYIPRADAVILGADAILKNGNIINKTGSLAAAILCKYYKKPCIVMASKDKFSNKIRFRQKEQEDGEIWEFHDTNLNVSNYYFEEVPNNLITNIFSG